MIRWGEGIFDCVRISLDVTKPLARFASLIKDGKRGVFQVTYEEGTASLKKTREGTAGSVCCVDYSMLGHNHMECSEMAILHRI